METEKQKQLGIYTEIKTLVDLKKFDDAKQRALKTDTCKVLRDKTLKVIADKKAEIEKDTRAARLIRSDLYAVSGLENPDGLQVIWMPGGGNYTLLKDAMLTEFGDADFVSAWMPDQPTAVYSLGRAVQTLGRKKYNLDNLKEGKNGVWAISDKIGTRENHVGIKYLPQLRAEIGPADNIIFSNKTHELIEPITRVFEEVRNSLPTDSIRPAVQRFIKKHCDAVSLAGKSGCEYVRREYEDTILRYVEVMKSTTTSTFTLIEMFHGPHTVKAVSDSIIRETMEELTRTRKSLEKGTGKRGLNSRIDAMIAQQQKLERFAASMDLSFTGVMKSLDDMRFEVTANIIEQEAEHDAQRVQ